MINQFLGVVRRNFWWFAAWAGLSCAFVSLDAVNFAVKSSGLNMLSAGLKYLGVVLCFIFLAHKRGKDHKLLFAMALTLLADTCLMWLNWQFIGVGVFILAQFFHILRLSQTGVRFLPLYATIIILVVSYCAYSGVPTIYAIAFAYVSALILHISLAGQRWSLNRQYLPAVCGLVGVLLFLACDICVALQFLGSNSNYFGEFGVGVAAISGFLVFIFYLPSQILLCFSGRDIMRERDL